MNDLLNRLEADIGAHGLIRAGQTVLVGVSGGLDSMVLLTVLRRLGARHRWRVVVAHFNHGLRGRQSDADERFVGAEARRWNLSFVAGAAKVPLLDDAQGLSVEMAARKARHEFLARTARARGARTIALGHHADDQVELFFLRLLRGAGSLGLGGMRRSSPSPADPRRRLIRPLLGCWREELRCFARVEGVGFREDKTNACLDMLRNRVRHELLPLLERGYQPGVRKVVLREMEMLEAEAALVGELARDWREQGRGKRFPELALALQRRLLCDQLMELGIDPAFERVEQLRLEPGQPLTVGPGVAVSHRPLGRVSWVRLDSVRFAPGQERISLLGRGGRGTFGGLAWQWKSEACRGATPPRFGKGWEWFDADKVGAEVVLRHWRAGDRFRPSGMPDPIKLQDLFTNRKVPRARRHELVVATTARGEIWWVEGLRIAEDYKLSRRTGRRLKWCWQRQCGVVSGNKEPAQRSRTGRRPL